MPLETGIEGPPQARSLVQALESSPAFLRTALSARRNRILGEEAPKTPSGAAPGKLKISPEQLSLLGGVLGRPPPRGDEASSAAGSPEGAASSLRPPGAVVELIDARTRSPPVLRVRKPAAKAAAKAAAAPKPPKRGSSLKKSSTIGPATPQPRKGRAAKVLPTPIVPNPPASAGRGVYQAAMPPTPMTMAPGTRNPRSHKSAPRSGGVFVSRTGGGMAPQLTRLFSAIKKTRKQKVKKAKRKITKKAKKKATKKAKKPKKKQAAKKRAARTSSAGPASKRAKKNGIVFL